MSTDVTTPLNRVRQPDYKTLEVVDPRAEPRRPCCTKKAKVVAVATLTAFGTFLGLVLGLAKDCGSGQVLRELPGSANCQCVNATLAANYTGCSTSVFPRPVP